MVQQSEIENFRNNVLPKYEEIVDAKRKTLERADIIRANLKKSNITVPEELMRLSNDIIHKRKILEKSKGRSRGVLVTKLSGTVSLFKTLALSVIDKGIKSEVNTLKEVNGKLGYDKFE